MTGRMISQAAGCTSAPVAPVRDVCRPRLRRCLLLVGCPGEAGAVVTAAADRLATQVVQCRTPREASERLAAGKVGCVLLVPDPDSEPLAALAALERHCRETPIVVLGREIDPTLAVAAVQAGAQDYVLQGEIEPATLERAIRYAIDRKRTEVQLAHLAHHDPLTGLPNRGLFVDRLEDAIRDRSTDGTPAVLFCDVDGFKRINDHLGHRAGDSALCAAADRIKAVVRPGDTLARLGGDEFTILCDKVPDAAAAISIAERVAAALERPLVIDGAEVVLRASIGVAVADEQTTSPDALLCAADEAMYEAKRRGGGRWRVYDPAARRAANAVELEAALRHAIPDQLRVVYQPRVRLSDGAIVGAEALMRWEHPDRGTISPADFIPVAEATGLIVPMGRWILEAACAEAVRWDGERSISVNVSARQVVDRSLVEDVRRALARSGLEPGRLHLELTESILMEDLEETASVVRALGQLGVKLELDDFGTGWSSLSYLKRFPVDAIKIDQAFVRGLPDARADVAIVSAVISFAGALGLDVVAEGVETADHVAALLDLGCEQAQGFHFHRPLAPEVMRELARD